jgi:hypothetical protein
MRDKTKSLLTLLLCGRFDSRYLYIAKNHNQLGVSYGSFSAAEKSDLSGGFLQRRRSIG